MAPTSHIYRLTSWLVAFHAETLAKMRPNDTKVALDQPTLSINVIPHLPQEEMALLVLLALAAG